MTDLATLPFVHDDGRLPNGAKGRKCWRHEWHYETRLILAVDDDGPIYDSHDQGVCDRCGAVRDPIVSRRNRANGKRGRRAELTIAREIPGARKMGPLGLPWDVEVGEYARLQVKKLVSRPSANAIRKLIEAIPNTGDRLRGFVWVEAAGQGKRGRREVWFTWDEFVSWHGIGEASAWDTRDNLLTLPLADWVETFVQPGVMVVVGETR